MLNKLNEFCIEVVFFMMYFYYLILLIRKKFIITFIVNLKFKIFFRIYFIRGKVNNFFKFLCFMERKLFILSIFLGLV